MAQGAGRSLVSQVCGRDGLVTEEQATRAIEATLSTLAERLGGGLPQELLAGLPDPLRARLERPAAAAGGRRQVFDIEEFFRRVGEREAVDLVVAVGHVVAVTDALCETLSAATLAGMRVDLPEEFQRLFVGRPGGAGRVRP